MEERERERESWIGLGRISWLISCGLTVLASMVPEMPRVECWDSCHLRVQSACREFFFSLNSTFYGMCLSRRVIFSFLFFFFFFFSRLYLVRIYIYIHEW